MCPFRSYSGPDFPTFGLNTERYGVSLYRVSLRTQFECGKMRTRITPNTDTFYTVILFSHGNMFFNDEVFSMRATAADIYNFVLKCLFKSYVC